MNTFSLDPDRLDAVLVDLDGTTIDTIGDFVVAVNRMLDDLGWREVPRERLERMIGKGSEYLIMSVLQDVAATGGADAQTAQAEARANFDRAWERYLHHYLAINGQYAAVYPGVVEGLKALRGRGLKLVCLTNKPTAFAKPLLAQKGLDGFFDLVFGGDAFERKKPDPLPLLKACEALGTVPARTLMIGDSSNDARAARAAGCPVVLVTYGYNHGEPVRGVDADGFLDSLAELLAPHA